MGQMATAERRALQRKMDSLAVDLARATAENNALHREIDRLRELLSGAANEARKIQLMRELLDIRDAMPERKEDAA